MTSQSHKPLQPPGISLGLKDVVDIGLNSKGFFSYRENIPAGNFELQPAWAQSTGGAPIPNAQLRSFFNGAGGVL
jgi:hypothetical protein